MIAGAIVALALLVGWCGRGWFGGGGDGESNDERAATPARTESAEPAESRCHLRVDARGVSVDGERTGVDDAVAACAALGEADLLVTGDAVYGVVQQLEAGLARAGVRVYTTERSPGGAADEPGREPEP